MYPTVSDPDSARRPHRRRGPLRLVRGPDAARRRIRPAAVRMMAPCPCRSTPSEGAELLTPSLVLTGLRVPKLQVAELFRGVRAMRESSGYQLILDEGREEGALRQARKVLLRVGGRRLG